MGAGSKDPEVADLLADATTTRRSNCEFGISGLAKSLDPDAGNALFVTLPDVTGIDGRADSRKRHPY